MRFNLFFNFQQAYHQSAATLRTFEPLRLPVLVAGPHGYSASPIEYFFSLLKSTQLNDQYLHLGKSNFDNVARIVTARAA